MRRIQAGRPVDTDNNASDFVLVAPDAGLDNHGVTPVLGAPEPQNLASPVQRNDIAQSFLLDQGAAAAAAPNRVYNAASSTLTVRRRITNISATSTITSLRLRFTSITTVGSATPAQAVLRAETSTGGTVATSQGTRAVVGVTLDEPPYQDVGGGLSSSLSVPLPSGGLGPGASVYVELRFHVDRGGSFAFGYNAEALVSP